MAAEFKGKIAILYPGDAEVRRSSTPDNNRLATVFAALAEVGVEAEPAVYNDEFVDEVREQLMKVDGVLVWRNPIQDGADRSVLDPMLREVADAGIFVSAHPDVILKMGTKEVLYATRHLGWGCDTHLYRTPEALREGLPKQLASGARVLKQFRGNGGNGVWRVELVDPVAGITAETPVRVRHAKRGEVEKIVPLSRMFEMCASYFEDGGKVVDQAYQPRLPDGMIRCYLTGDRVVGFGHQEVNALFPAPDGSSPENAPQPGMRLYYPPDKLEFQDIRRLVEGGWVADMQDALDIATDDLPLLWDCDFMFGARDAKGKDSYILCEINCSSVAPYPDTAPMFIAKAVVERLRAGR